MIHNYSIQNMKYFTQMDGMSNPFPHMFWLRPIAFEFDDRIWLHVSLKTCVEHPGILKNVVSLHCCMIVVFCFVLLSSASNSAWLHAQFKAIASHQLFVRLGVGFIFPWGVKGHTSSTGASIYVHMMLMANLLVLASYPTVWTGILPPRWCWPDFSH